MNILIVEDEAHTALLLQEIIEQSGDFKIVKKVESVIEAVQYLSKHQNKLDLLFFDIQLADGLSFEIFKHVDVVVPVVFCTAFEEFTLDAIKSNGIDYILKPFKDEDIYEALQKYKRLISHLESKHSPPIQFISSQVKLYQQNFLTSFRGQTVVKQIQEIALFLVENEAIYLHTLPNKKYPIFKKMEYLESVCDPSQFFRINRQMLINREVIESFEPYANRKVMLQLKINIPQSAVVSRLKVAAFKEWLEQ